jgi:hypothetical protein
MMMTLSGAPLGAPPGLEPDIDAAFFAASGVPEVDSASQASESLEETLGRFEGTGDALQRQAVADAIRQQLRAEVESKVKERADELWTKGKQVVKHMKQKHEEHAKQLMSDLEQSQRKQQELQVENAQLKQALQEIGKATQLTLSGTSRLAARSPSLMPGTASPALAAATAPAPGLAAPLTPLLLPAAAPTGAETPQLMPSVPAFPFPSPNVLQAAVQAAPLSLADALGQSTPTQQPRQSLSLADSLGGTPTQVMPSPFTTNGQAGQGLVCGSGIFSFTLRKADGVNLGLNVSHVDDDESDRCLRVESVQSEGAVASWNKQCLSTSWAEKAVIPGDRIICVNTAYYNTVKMLEECKNKQLLKITVVRGNIPLPAAPTQQAAQQPSGKKELRAGAEEFVPSTSDKENGTMVANNNETKEK